MRKIQQKSKFLWVGNWPAIDFINTEIIADHNLVDLLQIPQDVIVWLAESRVSRKEDLKSSPPRQLLECARTYRGLLRNGIAAYVHRKPVSPGLTHQTNHLLSQSVCARRIVSEGKEYRVESHWRFDEPETYLVPIAESFTKLITEADRTRIRKCKNPECVLYFYDTSKGGKRTWCSLDLCGNKLRMAASRQRREELL